MSGLVPFLMGQANRLRQGYGGPPKLYAKAEAGHDVLLVARLG
jgi:hypothetical protein